MPLRKTYNEFRTRAEFAHYHFAAYLQGSVCDVGAGGSPAHFRPLLAERYLAVDVAETRSRPDVVCNFETERLPFEDRRFDTVLCFDCLEHCDDPYRVFDELCRVSKRHVIVSLPNNWPGFIASLLAGHNITHQLGYGLPAARPGPGVRHKWWFNLEEAEKFLLARAEASGFRALEIKHAYEPNSTLIPFPWYPATLANYVTTARIRSLIEDEAYRRKLGRLRGSFEFAVRRLGAERAASWLPRAARVAAFPFFLLDEGLKQLIWGLGSRYRYLNMFCRQVWVVLERA
jgi:SAM-dependent methyltransferase